MGRIKWTKIVELARSEAEAFRALVGTSPILRTLFYRLVSRGTIPNTQSAYKTLSSKLSRARKEGRFPWELLKDDTRVVMGGDRGPTLKEVEKEAENIALIRLLTLKEYLDEVEEADIGFSTLKWERQPKRAVICLEKAALADAVSVLTRGWRVEVHVMRGYSSTTHMKKLAEKIGFLAEEARVHVLLLTDFDPSGQDIARYVKETLLRDFGVDCEVEKVAVTLDQIQRYGLPHRPEDAEERAKMARDPRFKNWGHGFFRVELDALLAYVPDELSRILNDAIAKRFDPGVEASVKAEAERLEAEAEAQLMDLSKKLTGVRSEIERIIRGYAP